MTLALRPSRACLALVQRFEGCRRRAARLPGGGWTVGYGHTASAREGAEVTAEDAEALLIWDLDRAGAAVRALTFAPLNQNQFDALTAFAFNIGAERFRGSVALRLVNAGEPLSAAAALEAWRNAEFEGSAQVIDGLVRRRAAEKALFLTPPEGFRFVPTGVLRPEPDGPEAPGAADHVAEVEAPMSGEVAVVQRVRAAAAEPAPPLVEPAQPVAPRPVEAAADAVSSRLQTLFPESDGAPTRSAAEPVEAHPLAPPLSHDAPPAPPPEPPAESSPEPLPEPPPPPFPERPAAPVFPHADAPAPPPPAPAIGADDPFTAPSAAEPSERSSRVHYRAATTAPEGFAEEARGAPASDRLRLYALVGLLGLVMFLAAIAWIVKGQADARNLLLGLAGVILMAPAFAALVLPRLNRGGERS